jgi:hypothetical protein
MRPRAPWLQLSNIGDAAISPLAVPCEDRICNPSIAVGDRGVYYCIIRSVNYDLDKHGRVLTAPAEGFQSFNWLADLDADFRITRLERIDDSAVGIDRQPWNRLEDCRLFRWKDAWWFTATWVLHDAPRGCQIVLCRLEGSKVVEWQLLPSPVGSRMEKNWMPCVDGDQLKWIYWIDPTEMLTYRDGDLSREYLRRYGRLEKWAGSSPLVRYRGNWLGVVHLRKDWRHVSSFEHRLVELDDDFHLKRMSRAFTFENKGVEYCAGFCLTQTHAILSYGIWDREAKVMRLDLSVVEAMLRPLRVPRWLSILVADMWRAARPWIRQPRKKFHEALGSRGFGVLGTFGLSDIAISAAEYADLTMQLTRQCIRLAL